MKLLHQNLKLKSESDVLTIIPFGCVHADDQGHNEELWEQCIKEIADTPNCLAVGCGDYKNFLRTTARKHIRSYVADEDSWRDMDQMVRKEAAEFVKKYLSRIKDKLVGLAEGNHYYEFSSGGTDTQYMCQLLGVPYLDKPAFIRLKVTIGNSKGHERTAKIFKILVHHGDWSGGYSRIGGDVNAAELKALGFDFDVYIFSHTHKAWGMHIPSITLPQTGQLRVIERPRAFIRTGCFMRGYVENCQGRYVDKKLLNPSAMGYVRLTMKFYRSFNKETYSKLRASKTPSVASSGSYEGLNYKFEVRY